MGDTCAMHRNTLVRVLVSTALSLAVPALAVNDAATARAGAGASIEGGASLGGTGINNGPGALGTGLDINFKPTGTLRIPVGRKDDGKAAPEAQKDGDTRKDSEALRKDEPKSSAGASRPRGSLSEEADKQDEEFRKKRRLDRGK